jgi:hypothetical protein
VSSSVWKEVLLCECDTRKIRGFGLAGLRNHISLGMGPLAAEGCARLERDTF